MTKEILVAAWGIMFLLFSLAYCDAHAQDRGTLVNKQIKCYEMDEKFQKFISERFYIKAAGIGVDSEGKNLPENMKIISMVLFSKENDSMILVEVINSNIMCILSQSKEPRYINANSNQGSEEEIYIN